MSTTGSIAAEGGCRRVRWGGFSVTGTCYTLFDAPLAPRALSCTTSGDRGRERGKVSDKTQSSASLRGGHAPDCVLIVGLSKARGGFRIAGFGRFPRWAE